MKPVIDQELCVGCGVCESIYPEVFKLHDDGKAHVIKEDNIDEQKLQEAIDQCPVQCISKTD